MELAVMAPFAIATLAGWCAVGFLFFRLVRDSIWSTGWILVLLCLAALCALVTRQVVADIKDISAPREVDCLEK